MINNDEKLLLVGKIIVSDMDEIARLRVDVPVFYGMGQALNRVYCVLRNIPFKDIPKLKPMEMMQWFRDQKLSGIPDSDQNSEQLIKLVSH